MSALFMVSSLNWNFRLSSQQFHTIYQNFLLGLLTGSVDDGMMTAAQSKPGLETAFRAANDHWQRQDAIWVQVRHQPRMPRTV
jgi:hypothetical protein